MLNFYYHYFKHVLKHDYRWKSDGLQVLILAKPVQNITRKSKDKTTNAAKTLYNSRQNHVSCACQKQANKENPGWAIPLTGAFAAQLKDKKEQNGTTVTQNQK